MGEIQRGGIRDKYRMRNWINIILEGPVTIPHHERDEDELDKRMEVSFTLPGGGGMAIHLGTIAGYDFIGRWPLIVGNNFYLVKDGVPIAWLSTKAMNPYMGQDKNEQKIRFIWVRRQYRKQGLALAMYTDLIRRGAVLWADDRQTLNAQSLWRKLGTVPGIEVTDVGDGQLVARLSSSPRSTVPNDH